MNFVKMQLRHWLKEGRLMESKKWRQQHFFSMDELEELSESVEFE